MAHIVKAAAVKISIGGASGNRVAALLRRGDILPDGIAEEQLKRLTDRGLIEKQKGEVELPDGKPTDAWTVPQLEKYAKDNNIDLGESKAKPEKLEKIQTALAAD